MQTMLDYGVSTRRGIMCAHREAAYQDMVPRQSLAHSEAAQTQCVLLPIYPRMTAGEQERVAEILREACLGQTASTASRTMVG